MHWAASAPDVGAVDTFLQAKADVHSKNIVGMTPLHWASAWGRLPAARSLLRAGADRDALDVRKASPAQLVHLINADARSAGKNAAGRMPLYASAAQEAAAQEAAKQADREAKVAMLSELVGPAAARGAA